MNATAKSVRLLGRRGESVDTIQFSYDDDGSLAPAERCFAVYLERDAYLAMGSPEKITVSIEPGDLLNRASGPVVDDPQLETALAAEGIHVGSYDPPRDTKPAHDRVQRIEE